MFSKLKRYLFELSSMDNSFIIVMVMLSAYVVSFTGACGVGGSDVYMLNNVGDITAPCGTLVLKWRCVDVLFLIVVYACAL